MSWTKVMGVRSSRAKGRATELAFKVMMEKAGWDVWLVQPPRRFNKENDFGGLFDAVCLKGQYRKYVQIKTNSWAKKQPFIDWGKKFVNEFESVEFWSKFDYKGWRSRIIYNIENIEDTNLDPYNDEDLVT